MTVMKCIICGASNSDNKTIRFPKKEAYRTNSKKFANLTNVVKTSKPWLCIDIGLRHFSEAASLSPHQSKGSKRKVEKTHILINRTAIPTLNKNCTKPEQYNEKSSVRRNIRAYVCLICQKHNDGRHFSFPKKFQMRNEGLRLSDRSQIFNKNIKQISISEGAKLGTSTLLERFST